MSRVTTINAVDADVRNYNRPEIVRRDICNFGRGARSCIGNPKNSPRVILVVGDATITHSSVDHYGVESGVRH